MCTPQDLHVDRAILLLRRVFHDDDDTLHAGHQVHGAALPFTIFPGIIQLARSPFSETCMAPRIARLIWPPRIMRKLSAEEKKLEPGNVVTVCLPALMRSASTSFSIGKGPMPSRPFSDCSNHVHAVGDVVRNERRQADAEVQ